MTDLSTLFTPLETKNEINCWENRPFAKAWPENIQQDTKDVARLVKKKKRNRTTFTPEQLQCLEMMYSKHKYIDLVTRAAIANRLKISDRRVKTWFQNRRMKEKKESSEFNCDSSSELVSIESLSVYTQSSWQMIITKPTTEQISHYPDSTYQRPTYCNTNEPQSTYEDINSFGSPTYFYNERTVYPTQYNPQDLGFSNEGHGYDQYANEGNNSWTGSQYPYYSTA